MGVVTILGLCDLDNWSYLNSYLNNIVIFKLPHPMESTSINLVVYEIICLGKLIAVQYD